MPPGSSHGLFCKESPPFSFLNDTAFLVHVQSKECLEKTMITTMTLARERNKTKIFLLTGGQGAMSTSRIGNNADAQCVKGSNDSQCFCEGHC